MYKEEGSINRPKEIMEKSRRQLVLGIIFILAGTVFLLDNLDVLEFRIPEYVLRWESLLILVGVISLFSRNFSAAFTLITLGVFFWILRDHRISFFDLWPVVLIIIGFSFLIKQGMAAFSKKGLQKEQKKF